MGRVRKAKSKAGGLLAEFKAFAVRGNIVDMAVAAMVGGAFGRIVSSLVGDILTPLVGMLMGGVNLTDMTVIVNESTVLRYGQFLQNIIDFIIIALCIFFFVKLLNRVRALGQGKKEETNDEKDK